MRWPFRVAIPVVLLAVFALWQSRPWLAEKWTEHQASREVQSDIKRVAPAVRALNRMALPDNVAPCAAKAVNELGLLCLRGSATVLASTASLTAALESLHAGFSDRRCVQLREMTLCTIAGQIQGQPFAISLGPDTTRKPSGGVFVSGGMGRWTAMPLPRGVPVSFPTR